MSKIGNAHPRWAFAEAACLFLRSSARAKKWKQKQAAQRGEGKALAILAAKLGRAVYHMLRKGEAFEPYFNHLAHVAAVLAEEKVRTPDLGGKSSTEEVTDAVLEKLG